MCKHLSWFGRQRVLLDVQQFVAMASKTVVVFSVGTYWGNVFGERPYLAGPRCSQCADGGGCTSEGLCGMLFIRQIVRMREI
ncbi:unnamed protein product [Anisakis simplex]|uniref:Secreted protein n=1 Tax=Anisakis simplex TaxID=6269 RepID=A0A0M3J2N2_ANISI|nr:unnamed protein product [Anisakis simplex]